MLKRGDILRNTWTGRYEVVRRVSSCLALPDHYLVTTFKVRKDGISWGRDKLYVLTDSLKYPGCDLPWRCELIPAGKEPSTLAHWRR